MRSEHSAAIEALLLTHSTLYAAAAALPERVALQGRVPAYAITVGSEQWLFRHYHRGGAIEPLLRDRYATWGGNRALRELLASVDARARGIPTPEVIAAAQYLSGPVARFDIVVQYIPGARDLAALLFSSKRPVEDAHVENAAGLIRNIVKNGLMHPDLNLKNILVTDEQGWVVDLDRAVVRPQIKRSDAIAMHARFVRSLEKWQEMTGKTIAGAHRLLLEEAFRV